MLLAATGGGMSGTFWVLYIVIIFAFMYFVVIRPQNKQKKQQTELMNSM